MQRARPTTTPTDVYRMLPPPQGEMRRDMRAAATVIGNEISKGLIDLWRGKLGSFLELILFGIFFLVINFAVGRGTFQQDRLAPILLGFVGYIFFHMQTNRLFWGLLGEMQSGTLEQLYLSPFPSWLFNGWPGGRVHRGGSPDRDPAGPLDQPGRVRDDPAAVGCPAATAHARGGQRGIFPHPRRLTPRFKRLEVLKELFQTVVLIFGGVFFSVDRMPGWMATIARFLPLTPGVEGLRQTLLEGVSLGSLAADGTLLWLVGNAAAYLVLGIVIFRWCERITKRHGTLGQY